MALTCICVTVLALISACQGTVYSVGEGSESHFRNLANGVYGGGSATEQEKALAEYISRTEMPGLKSPLIPIKTPFPKYPRKAMREGITGVVAIRFTVDSSGSVSHIEVLRSSHSVLTSAVVASVRRWKFEPPAFEENQQEIELWQNFPFHSF